MDRQEVLQILNRVGALITDSHIVLTSVHSSLILTGCYIPLQQYPGCVGSSTVSLTRLR
jgi:hypothetical protein